MGRRDTLILSILTVITAVAWAFFDIYHSLVDTTIPKDVEAQLVPITPSFNLEVLESIKNRQNIEPLTTEDLSQSLLETNIASPGSTTNIATKSGQL